MLTLAVDSTLWISIDDDRPGDIGHGVGGGTGPNVAVSLVIYNLSLGCE